MIITALHSRSLLDQDRTDTPSAPNSYVTSSSAGHYFILASHQMADILSFAKILHWVL